MSQSLSPFLRYREKRIGMLDTSRMPEEFHAHCTAFDEALKFKNHQRKDEMPPHVWNFKLAEWRENRMRERTTPEEWAFRVSKISDENLRTTVARIIWWDHFSTRCVTDRWPHLDSYLGNSSTKTIDPETLMLTLWRCGYSPAGARNRAIKGDVE